MAEIETLDVSQLLANTYTAKQKNLWILEIDGIDAFTCVSANRPQITFDEVEIHYLNLRRYYAGKGQWNEISLTLNDPIAPSAAQRVMQWVLLQFEPITGRSGYPSFYQKDITLKLIDGLGNVVEKWILRGAFIKDANFNDLDFASAEPVQITLGIRYQRADLIY